MTRYLNHLDVSGALEELSELSAVDVEGEVTDEELEVRREGLLPPRGRRSVVVSEDAVFFD